MTNKELVKGLLLTIESSKDKASRLMNVASMCKDTEKQYTQKGYKEACEDIQRYLNILLDCLEIKS